MKAAVEMDAKVWERPIDSTWTPEGFLIRYALEGNAYYGDVPITIHGPRGERLMTWKQIGWKPPKRVLSDYLAENP